MVEAGKIHYLPQRISGLSDLALNLWWRWNRRARVMLQTIDPAVWSRTRHNPVATLRMAEPARLAHLAQDPEFLEVYDAVMEDFEAARTARNSWFHENFPELLDRPVAYFCAEFGLHNSIPIYSGGLGVLAGDHCKSAADLGVPFIGVGLLYSKGYFDQKVNLDGWQENSDEPFDHRIMPLQRLAGPDGSYRITTLDTSGYPVGIGCWKLNVGSTSLYLLDTDLPENRPEDRQLTYQLYGGGQEYRLKQEWILGVGGVRVLRALGIDPAAWHANEGHAAFMMVERLREKLDQGTSWDEGIREIRSRSVFTTHTPVPAGHDIFSQDLVRSICGSYHTTMGVDEDTFMKLGKHESEDDGRFHMTATAIRLSGHVNGVSKRHGEVSREIWKGMWPAREVSHVPIGAITNGVHLGSWMAHRYMGLLDEVFGEGWDQGLPTDEMWDRVMELDDERVWRVHMRLKKMLLRFCTDQARTNWKTKWKESAHLVGAGTLLQSEPFTIGFARRFATYKRGALLLEDPDRLERLLTDVRAPVQLVFAGKAHPADDEGKKVLQRIYHATRDPRFEGRIAFVEDYDLHVAHRLVQGVDLWLNLPRVPKEASGTSGMKAALNGVPQLSTVDGWWAEGFNGTNGWAIPLASGSIEEVDAEDHRNLMELLEREIVPEFYDRVGDGIPHRWVHRMKSAIAEAGKHFTTGRMVKDYATTYYLPALRGHLENDDPPKRNDPVFLGEHAGV